MNCSRIHAPCTSWIRAAAVLLFIAAVPACQNSQKTSPPSDGGMPPPTSDTVLPPAAGSIAVGPSSDFIPLFNGQVLIGDTSTSRVNLLNIVTGTVDAYYQLSAAPGDLELDSTRNYLYVALVSATQLARIDLSSGQIVYIAVSAPVATLALGNNGIVFANLTAGYSGPIAVIDGLTATVVTTLPGTVAGFDRLMVYDRTNDVLITGSWALSPASLTRYSYDSTAHTLTQVQYVFNAGDNGQQLVLSPDRQHLGFPCGAGNGAPSYTIFDYDPSDVTVSYGAWNTGPYPRAIAWTPDSQRVIASNGTALQLFDVATHTSITSYTLDFSACNYSEIVGTGVSKGGKIGYGFSNCGSPATSGRLYWVLLP